MPTIRTLFDRFFNPGGGEENDIIHVTWGGATIVDAKKLFQREEVRKNFETMRSRDSGARRVFISGKK